MPGPSFARTHRLPSNYTRRDLFRRTAVIGAASLNVFAQTARPNILIILADE
jgi:hypothetical protein